MAVIDRDRWRDLEPLLDIALELPADDQAKWLDGLRRSSPGLAAELTSLLSGEAIADAHGFLTEQLEASLEGLKIGAYTLERFLGQGGMGSVWLARRTDGRFEGQAAVKLLNLSLVTRTGQERFRREGSVLARLAHPSIGRLLDAGVAASGQPYLILEHVDGEPIDVYVSRRSLPRDERIRIFLRVLAAVGHAHANLIVHRDLKPTNILVTADGSVKLLDFGIAKLLDAEGTAEQPALTVEGARAFTPEFAAPEQVRGDAVTTPTDVYSLGVLLYVLLSGRHPTAAGCRTEAEMIQALLEAEPARLGLGDLDTILRKALRKAPDERYQTVASLAEDLERYLGHEPVSARSDSPAYRLRKFLRRHRSGAAIGAIMIASLVAATLFSLRQMREARRQRDAAVEAKRYADAQIEFQTLLTSQIGDEPITMREILDRARTVLERQYGDDPRVLPAILIQLGARYEDLGDGRPRGELLAKAESIAVAHGDIALLPEIRCNLVDNLRTQGRYDEARSMLGVADSLLRARPDAAVEATCLEYRADLESELGNGQAAEAAITRAIAIHDSLGNTSDMKRAELVVSLGHSLHQVGRTREGIVNMRRGVAILESTGRGRLLTRYIFEHNIAVAQTRLGEIADAQRILQSVLSRMAAIDPTGKLPSQPLIHYGHVSLYAGSLDSAGKYFAMLARQAVTDRNLYWEGRARFGLAQAQLQRGELAAFKRTADRVRQISRTTNLRSTDDQISDTLVLDGMLALTAGDTAVAYDRFVRALREFGYFEGKRRAVFHTALMLAAECALALRQPADAAGFAREARTTATRDSLTEQRSAFVGESRLMEARAALATGDTASARAMLERAVQALRWGIGSTDHRTVAAERLLASLGQ